MLGYFLLIAFEGNQFWFRTIEKSILFIDNDFSTQ
jgi:hypothetical protein